MIKNFLISIILDTHQISRHNQIQLNPFHILSPLFLFAALYEKQSRLVDARRDLHKGPFLVGTILALGQSEGASLVGASLVQDLFERACLQGRGLCRLSLPLFRYEAQASHEATIV